MHYSIQTLRNHAAVSKKKNNKAKGKFPVTVIIYGITKGIGCNATFLKRQ
jgi:hypothetical protein